MYALALQHLGLIIVIKTIFKLIIQERYFVFSSGGFVDGSDWYRPKYMLYLWFSGSFPVGSNRQRAPMTVLSKHASVLQ